MAAGAGGRRGRRESQWLVMRRCLAILRRVQRGAATRAELLATVRTEVGADAYAEADPGAERKRLEKDLERIRAHLLIDLYYDRRAGGYTIRDTWLPLLDLPDQDLAALAWLEKTFDAASPQHEAVQALLQHLRQLLAPERLGLLERLQRGGPAMDLACRDEDSIPPEVWEALRRALAQRRRIAFHYLSPQRADGAPRLHVVDPWECYFDPARGHYYLRGWCYETGEGSSREVRERYIYYRLGRIRDLELRPEKLPPEPPPAPRYSVVYELAAHVARLGVSRPRGIQVERVEHLPGGGARVQGWCDNLFWATQALLQYGDACVVLGGAELRARMADVVGRMAELYGRTPGCGGVGVVE